MWINLGGIKAMLTQLVQSMYVWLRSQQLVVQPVVIYYSPPHTLHAVLSNKCKKALKHNHEKGQIQYFTCENNKISYIFRFG